MDQIHEHNWGKYLEREQPLLLFAAFNGPYGEMLRKTTGFGFSKQLYYFKDKIGVFYKLKEELGEADDYYAKIIADDDPRINVWIQKEKESHELIKSLDVDMPLKEILRIFQEILLYNVTIPFRLLSASKKVKLNKELLEQLEIIRGHSFYPEIVGEFFPKVFERLSKKYGISKKLFFLCTEDELIALDEGSQSISESDLNKRKEGCYFIKDKGWQFVFTPVDRYEETYQNELKGNIAFKGIAKGTVKIINNPSDIGKFSKGDILVSINTDPSLMPAINICSAIISDEGGVTCHAAIVARELKKPCIIGTKNATKVLKDGDIVEVDANQGIIKLIKKRE